MSWTLFKRKGKQPANGAQDALWKRLRILEAQLREYEHRLMLIENWRKSRQVSESRASQASQAKPGNGSHELSQKQIEAMIHGL